MRPSTAWGSCSCTGILFDTEPTTVDLDQHSTPVAGRRYPSLLRRALFEVPIESPPGGHERPDRRTGGRRGARGDGGKTGPCGPRTVPKLGSLLRLKLPDTVALPELPGYIPSPTHHPPSRCSTGTWITRASRWPSLTVPLNQVKQVRRAFPT